MVIRKGYKQTEVGVIPEDWDCREINSEIKEISMGPFGSDIPVSCFTSEGVPVLNGHSVSKIKLIDTFKNYVSEEKAKSLKKAVAQQGDIIVTHRGTIGQISYIPIGSRYKKYVISQSQFRVRLNQDAVNPHFVVSYFLSPKGQSFLLEKKGHTGVPALAQPTTNFRKLCIPLPSLPEQEQIVNAFEDIDDLILSLEKHISKRKAIKQGAMQELLTGKRRLSGFNEAWREVKLEDICSKITDGSHESPSESDVGYYMPSVKDMRDTGFDYSECKKISYSDFKKLERNGCRPNVGDVLIAKDGSILKYAFVQEKAENIVILSSIAIVTPLSDCVDSYFLAQYFRQQNFVEQVITNYKSGTGVPRIVLKGFKQIVLFVPESVAEQAAIAKILVDMDTEITGLEEKLAKYRQVKQGMMQQLLTGKIRLV